MIAPTPGPCVAPPRCSSGRRDQGTGLRTWSG